MLVKIKQEIYNEIRKLFRHIFNYSIVPLQKEYVNIYKSNRCILQISNEIKIKYFLSVFEIVDFNIINVYRL